MPEFARRNAILFIMCINTVKKLKIVIISFHAAAHHGKVSGE